MPSMRKRLDVASMSCRSADQICRGCEPLTPDDIAEVIVFAAGRRENVVLADTLIYPNHQVSNSNTTSSVIIVMYAFLGSALRLIVSFSGPRPPQLSCTGRHRGQLFRAKLCNSDKHPQAGAGAGGMYKRPARI